MSITSDAGRGQRTGVDVVAVSIAQYARVAREHLLLPHGMSVGRGYGPVVVTQKEKAQPLASFAGKRSKDLAAIHQRLSRAYLAEGDKPRALTELDVEATIEGDRRFCLDAMGGGTHRPPDARVDAALAAFEIQALSPHRRGPGHDADERQHAHDRHTLHAHPL